MSFIHSLLLSNRTTTTREVYYVFVTHFRNQKECDSAILDVARCLGVPRRALGLSASPKGVCVLVWHTFNLCVFVIF
jgi:meiotic recombination protein SPO11